MRFQHKKISARATALALVLGVVGVLVTALPAFAAADTVTSFTPICGVIGTSVTITGTGFTAGATASAVTFPGAANQPVVPTSDTQITTTVPAAATGTAPLTVVDADGNGTSVANFQVVIPTVAPTYTSFSPPSAAVGASVVIVGGGFCGATTVLFNATSATFVVNSNNQITATVPAGVTTGPIHVTTGAGTIASTTNFTPAGAPTITSFAPTSGNVGTSVTITGTNLLGVTSVKFNGVAATTIGTSTATSETATVPTGATTGKISVTTPGGTVVSTGDFTVTTVTKHSRTVTLKLKGQLTASGTVKVADGFNACRSNVTVKIQRLKNGTWKNVGSDQTASNGKYSANVEDKSGKYRAIAKKKTLNGGNDICVADTSPTVHHSHH